LGPLDKHFKVRFNTFLGFRIYYRDKGDFQGWGIHGGIRDDLFGEKRG